MLVILLSEMGSVVLAGPMFEALKKRHPGIELHVLQLHKNQSVMQLLGFVPEHHLHSINDRSLFALVWSLWSTTHNLRKLGLDGVIDCDAESEAKGDKSLWSEKEYGDFVLEYDFKVDPRLNSGVQIRSHVAPENGFQPKLGGKLPKDRLYGPQVEISTDGMAGRIYDEARRGRWLDTKEPTAETKGAFKKGEWNQYRVLAQGDRIQTWVNGIPIADVRDGEDTKGHIGLQVHGIARGTGPFQVRWKNLMIREPGR